MTLRSISQRQRLRTFLPQNNLKIIQEAIKKIPLFLIIAVFFLSVVFSAAYAGDKDNTPNCGDAFVFSSIGDARTLVPILASDAPSSEVAGMIFNGLVKYDEELNIVGDLARSWDIEDGGCTIIFHLRKGVKWHDGAPFTAKDVKFTYEKLIDPEVPTPYSGDFKKVKTFEVLDDHTIKVAYDRPFAPALSTWGMPVMPEHILKGRDLTKTSFSRCPIGTGPYMFKKWQVGSRIDLVSNPDYFEHEPYITRFIYRVIPDSDTMFLELLTKNIDIMAMTPLQYSRLSDTRQFKKNYNKYKLVPSSYSYLGFNLSSPFFSDTRVRQAINHAVDKKEIIDGVLLGLGEELTGPFLPGSWAYDKTVAPVSFEPAKARKLLAEAGWTDKDADGIVEKDGKKFEFTILTNLGNNQRISAAQIIQKRLMEIGIKAHIRVLEWTVFINEFINKKKFDAVLLGWNLSRDPDCYDIWHSSKTGPGEFNFLGYNNPEVDLLIEEGRGTFDIEKRKDAYHRIQRIIYDDAPCLFLYAPNGLAAVNNRFSGIKPSIIGLLYNFIDWYTPKGGELYEL